MKPRRVSAVLPLVTIAALAGCTHWRDDPTAMQHPRAWINADPSVITKLPPLEEPKIFPATYVAAGSLFESQLQFIKALEQYRKAIAVSHENVEAYNRLGMVLSRLGRFAQAKEALANAVRLRPASAVLRNNLAYAHLLEGNLSSAESELRRALQLAPKFTHARVNLGITLARTGRYEEALDEYLTVLPAPDAYYNIGLTYRADRKYDDAADAFAQALAYDPEFKAAEKQHEELTAYLTTSVEPGKTTEEALVDATDPPALQGEPSIVIPAHSEGEVPHGAFVTAAVGVAESRRTSGPDEATESELEFGAPGDEPEAPDTVEPLRPNLDVEASATTTDPQTPVDEAEVSIALPDAADLIERSVSEAPAESVDSESLVSPVETIEAAELKLPADPPVAEDDSVGLIEISILPPSEPEPPTTSDLDTDWLSLAVVGDTVKDDSVAFAPEPKSSVTDHAVPTNNDRSEIPSDLYAWLVPSPEPGWESELFDLLAPPFEIRRSFDSPELSSPGRGDGMDESAWQGLTLGMSDMVVNPEELLSGCFQFDRTAHVVSESIPKMNNTESADPSFENLVDPAIFHRSIEFLRALGEQLNTIEVRSFVPISDGEPPL